MTIKPVTIADINNEIVLETYFTAAEGLEGATARGSHGCVERPALSDADLQVLESVTICTLVLRNGTKVVGFNYGHIDPLQHRADQGRTMARAQAIDKVWELMTFTLRERMAQEASARQAESDSIALKSLLELVGKVAPIEAIRAWSDEERKQAEAWASAVHLKASDNDIEVPMMPECVRACPVREMGRDLASF